MPDEMLEVFEAIGLSRGEQWEIVSFCLQPYCRQQLTWCMAASCHPLLLLHCVNGLIEIFLLSVNRLFCAFGVLCMDGILLVASITVLIVLRR